VCFIIYSSGSWGRLFSLMLAAGFFEIIPSFIAHRRAERMSCPASRLAATLQYRGGLSAEALFSFSHLRISLRLRADASRKSPIHAINCRTYRATLTYLSVVTVGRNSSRYASSTPETVASSPLEVEYAKSFRYSFQALSWFFPKKTSVLPVRRYQP